MLDAKRKFISILEERMKVPVKELTAKTNIRGSFKYKSFMLSDFLEKANGKIQEIISTIFHI